MVDLTLFSSALSAVKTAREIAQLLKETDLSLEKAEQKSRLADLLYALAELKSELAEIQHEVIDRDEKIKQLQEALQIKKHIVWEQPYYWLQTNDNKEGPFCQRCYDQDVKLVRLQGYGEGRWECKGCKSFYKDKTFYE
ncbi:hypothetical protein C8R32_11069 [Nitrosospira sp. Nsp5]|uniref:Uncharacterized protein n=1 Tax=Nitrosospira multiformis TaxID=1231 RepID=A0ABY0T720_9PROT|nr:MULTISPECIES: hypothetical protein [Nitrosospira]PTR06586.1 hypothetical protein C8R32_11069 [Nitrosospira sp. Nsp5]SDQ37026.1 hypothetical protein SAMN05216402_0590 [Nitrosospira multiformis]